MQKRIPTIFGLGVLIIALIAGVFLLGDGPGVFAPRAAPETAPKKIKVTNITDSSFTVSFVTDTNTIGFIKYGTSANNTNSQAADDRDQLSGNSGAYKTHHITARGLSANTTYHYKIGTASRSLYDNNGSPFTVTTAKAGGVPSAAKTITGSVVTASGAPAEHSIVYVNTANASGMSALVRSAGSWAIPLSNARTTDLNGYVAISDETNLSIRVQGVGVDDLTSTTITVANSQPVPALSFGTGGFANPNEAPGSGGSAGGNTGGGSGSTSGGTSGGSAGGNTGGGSGSTSGGTSGGSAGGNTGGENTNNFNNQSAGTNQTQGIDNSQNNTQTSGRLGAMLDQNQGAQTNQGTQTNTQVETNEVVDLGKGDGQVVTTTTPVIIGTTRPQTVITIEVHSETQITQQLVTDANGNFELDIASLSKQLEPGEHTATYTYTDPTTGQQVSKTVNFTVKPNNLLAQAGTGGPYSSANPYPRPDAENTAQGLETTSTSTQSATTSAQDTTKGNLATRSSYPSTESGVPVSGSVGTTITLLLGGIFFLISAGWSFWISRQLA